MSSTEEITGPMRVVLDKMFVKMKEVDAALWAIGEIGVRPEYLHYGIPEICSKSIAFSLMLSLGEEYKRKKEMLSLLKEEEGIEGAMEAMLVLVEAM